MKKEGTGDGKSTKKSVAIPEVRNEKKRKIADALVQVTEINDPSTSLGPQNSEQKGVMCIYKVFYLV